MHHNHTTRPQHIRHHIGHHQGPMHHPPPVGMNMGPQVGPPQHHMTNLPPPHGANSPIGQYIPPHQRTDVTRFSHHNQTRLQQPMHQPSLQSKLRTPSAHHNGLLTTSIPPPSIQQKHLQQQAAITHQSNLSKHQLPPKHHVPIQNKLTIATKKSLLHISHPPPSLVQSKPPPLPLPSSSSSTSSSSTLTHQQSSNPSPQQQTILNSTQLVSVHSNHPSVTPQLPISQQQPSLSQPQISTSVPPPAPVNQNPSQQLQSIQLQNLQQQQHQPQNFQQQQQQNLQQQQLLPKQQSVQQQQNLQPEQNLLQQQSLLHQQSAQQVISKQHVVQPQQQHSTQLPSQSQNVSTISSTTNSVLVSITHQQIQQTQQTVVVHQQARQGQSLENQNPTTQIPQSSPTNNKNINISIPNETNSEFISGSSLPSTTNETLANSKEKTPMCLVNELARFNKIQHQYRLTGEHGPAHSKRFTVTLRLGDEEYTADGLSIKKAQHSAAADAVSKTKYQHPPAKSNRTKSGIKPGLGNITPTVELNALAMKLGEPTLYLLDNHSASDVNVRSNSTASSVLTAGQHHIIPPPSSAVAGLPQTQSNQFPVQLHNPNYFAENQYANFNRTNPPNGIYNSQRFPGYARRPFVKGPVKFSNNQRMIPYNSLPAATPREPCRITLVVGMRKFVGIGGTLQAARHDAATRALEVLKPLVTEEQADGSNASTDDANSDLKSPISLVHEIALKRNMSVAFDVTSEKGPPHMKTFLTICRVGQVVTEGEGNGKKISKKRAAENMLEELRKLPPVSPSRTIQTTKVKGFNNKRKPLPIKRKSRNIIKDQSEPEYEEEVNPISKLIQIQQALKEREPVYTVVEERGAPRRREFVIEVSVSGHTARGTGSNKKMAKRLAAENLLTLLGFSTTSVNGTTKDATNRLMTNNVESSTEKTHRVKFQDSIDIKPSHANGSSTNHQGRQIVPGILLMQQSPPVTSTTSVLKSSATNNINLGGNNESKVTSTSDTVTANTDKNIASGFGADGVRPKDQLLYLGQLLGFKVQYSDYPKGNHGAYLSIVTLSTEPPQLCHGAGNKIEDSQDEASITALRLLSELGLDNVKPKKSKPDEIKT